MLYGHLKMGKSVRPRLIGKTENELLTHIEQQLSVREHYYKQAKHVLDVSLMDDYEKIKITVRELRTLLNI